MGDDQPHEPHGHGQDPPPRVSSEQRSPVLDRAPLLSEQGSASLRRELAASSSQLSAAPSSAPFIHRNQPQLPTSKS